MSAKVIVICMLLGILSEVGSVAHRRLKNKGVQARSCVVSDFQVQENFNIQQYVGTWYTISQNGESPESFHRRSHYSLQENGALAMTTRRVSP
nr:apolipoprotein D-like [Lytechinus pictus]